MLDAKCTWHKVHFATPVMPPGLVPPPGLSVMKSTLQFSTYSWFGMGKVPSCHSPHTDALMCAQAYNYMEWDKPRHSTAEALTDIFGSPIPIVLSEGGFPMFTDMNWGDQIATT